MVCILKVAQFSCFSCFIQ